MAQNISLGPQENKLLLTLAKNDVSAFSIDEAKSMLQISDSSLRHILMNLTKKGRLERIRRGSYVFVPENAGPDLLWMEHPWAVLPHIIDTYYVGFWSAMKYWRMTEQIINMVSVATTARKRGLTYGYQRYQFVTISPKMFFGFVEQRARDNETFTVSSREKTIVDALLYPEYCGGMPEAAKAMWNMQDEVYWPTVLEMSKRTGVSVVLRRLGYLLSALEIEHSIANSLKNTFKGYQYLDPHGTRERINYSKEYGLIINRDEGRLLGWMDY